MPQIFSTLTSNFSRTLDAKWLDGKDARIQAFIELVNYVGRPIFFERDGGDAIAIVEKVYFDKQQRVIVVANATDVLCEFIARADAEPWFIDATWAYVVDLSKDYHWRRELSALIFTRHSRCVGAERVRFVE